jgi:hypothetical protein
MEKEEKLGKYSNRFQIDKIDPFNPKKKKTPWNFLITVIKWK